MTTSPAPESPFSRVVVTEVDSSVDADSATYTVRVVAPFQPHRFIGRSASTVGIPPAVLDAIVEWAAGQR